MRCCNQHGLITKLEVEFRQAEHNSMIVVEIVVVAVAAVAAAAVVVCALLFILVASLRFSPLSQVGVVQYVRRME